MPPTSLDPHLHLCQTVLEELVTTTIKAMKQDVIKIGQLLIDYNELIGLYHITKYLTLTGEASEGLGNSWERRKFLKMITCMRCMERKQMETTGLDQSAPH